MAPSFDPTALAFGNQAIGGNETRYLFIDNSAEGASTINLTVAAPFAVTPNSIAAAATPTRVTVIFTPPSAGAFTGTLRGGGLTCALSGTGVAAVAETAGGNEKYWEVELDHSAENTTFNSYLRLGSHEPNSAFTAPPARNDNSNLQDHRGHDLAAMIVDFRDDDRDRGTYVQSRFNTVAKRRAESAKLHTRGGWRDHSDGNRISTTRGDKIEVVQGNYHMLVLGRFDGRGDGARTDTSGGHPVPDTETQTPGAVMEVKWSPEKFGGTWKIVQETLKGDIVNRFHGDVANYFYGNIQENYVGAPDESDSLPGGGVVGEASTSDSNWVTGGASDQKKLRPTMISKTWAKTILSEVYTKGTEEKVEVTGFKWSNTIVKGFCLNTTSVAGMLVNTTQVAALLVDMVNAPIHLVEEISPLNIQLFAGLKLSVSASKSLEVEIDRTGIHLKADDLALAKTELNASIISLADKVTAIEGDATTLSGKVTALAAEEKTLVTNVTNLSTTTNILAVQINFV